MSIINNMDAIEAEPGHTPGLQVQYFPAPASNLFHLHHVLDLHFVINHVHTSSNAQHVNSQRILLLDETSVQRYSFHIHAGTITRHVNHNHL